MTDELDPVLEVRPRAQIEMRVGLIALLGIGALALGVLADVDTWLRVVLLAIAIGSALAIPPSLRIRLRIDDEGVIATNFRRTFSATWEELSAIVLAEAPYLPIVLFETATESFAARASQNLRDEEKERLVVALRRYAALHAIPCQLETGSDLDAKGGSA